MRRKDSYADVQSELQAIWQESLEIAAVCFVLATRAGLLSVGAVLASLYPGVTVVLARFVGQERIRRRQLFGLALAAVAVSLLAI